MNPVFEVQNLHANVGGIEIVKGVNLKVLPGEIHVIMGPNGSGKSTLSYSIAGHPKYTVTKGKILIDGNEVTNSSVDEKAKKGLFLAFQYPVEIPGVRMSNFLRASYNSVHTNGDREKGISVFEFKKMFEEKLQEQGMDSALAGRYLNEGFSGGEKKRSELLQLSVLQPKIAILDEIDSGLDIDAIQKVAEGITRNKNSKNAIIIITHYQRILNYVHPDKVHIMLDGKIVKSGGKELVEELESKGYEWLKDKPSN